MKKGWKIVIATVALSIIVIFGLMQYKKNQANQVLVPNTINRVLKIGVYQLISSLDKSFLREDGAGRLKAAIKGLNIPASVYIYTVKSLDRKAFFFSLPVQNPEVFAQTLTHNWHITPHKDGAVWKASSENQTLQLLFSKKCLVAAICTDSHKVTTVQALAQLADILEQRQVIPFNQSSLAYVIDSKDQIVFSDRKNLLGLSFENGAIHFGGSIELEQINPLRPLRTVRPAFSPAENAISLWMQADLSGLVNGKKWKAATDGGWTSDSLSGLLAHPFALTIGPPAVKTQTVHIGYSYDENFNQVEQVDTVETWVPRVHIFMQGPDPAILTYMKGKNLLQGDSNRITEKIWALFPLYSWTQDSTWIVSNTYQQAPAAPQWSGEPTEELGGLSVNFINMVGQKGWDWLPAWLNILTSLDVRLVATKTSNDSFIISGLLYFVDHDRNAFVQIAEKLALWQTNREELDALFQKLASLLRN